MKPVKKAYAEVREFGRLVGVMLDEDTFTLPFEIAEELIEHLWRAGCRPQGVRHELGALRTLLFGWRRDSDASTK